MTSNFGSDRLAEVQQEPGERPVLVLVRELRHRPDAVWRALVEPDQLPQWSPYTADRRLDQLGPVTFTMIDGSPPPDGAGRAELSGQVRVAEPPRRLEYTIDADTVRWELEPAAGGTRLTLRQSVQDPAWLAKVAAGWHICLAVAERLLDGDPVGPITGRDALQHGWPQLHDRYAARLGAGSPTAGH